jgi:stress-induced morphogen
VNNFEEEVNVHNLINDLDIKVIKEGTEYLPWKLNKDFLDPYPLKGNNDSDNVEKIEIENAGKGVYTVEISHKHNLKYKHQDFSLIISDQKFGGISVLNKNEVVKNQIEIWPNPISEYINVQIPSEYALKDLTVAIFDINGKLVKKKNKIKTTTVIISTIDLDPGIYIVKISEGGLDATRRIIKK